jgi:hypothetical protein
MLEICDIYIKIINMRRFDKLKNIKKVNLLAEQRYVSRINESTEMDLFNIIGQKAEGFSKEDGDFDNNKFEISLLNDRIDGLTMNSINIDAIVIDAMGKYNMISNGYSAPGRYYGPPEDSYPDESENPEFDVLVTDIKIGRIDGAGDVVTIMELNGPDVQKMPKSILSIIEGKVIDMLLDSGRFDDYNDEPDRYDY